MPEDDNERDAVTVEEGVELNEREKELCVVENDGVSVAEREKLSVHAESSVSCANSKEHTVEWQQNARTHSLTFAHRTFDRICIRPVNH